MKETKLNSKNPILRFKQGKKILFAGGGDEIKGKPSKYIVTDNSGNRYYTNPSSLNSWFNNLTETHSVSDLAKFNENIQSNPNLLNLSLNYKVKLFIPQPLPQQSKQLTIEATPTGKKIDQQLRSNNLKKEISFKEAFNLARANKQRYFNWRGKMYNSKSSGNDKDYESFTDNMEEMSKLLPTSRKPTHLGWETGNKTSDERRGADREVWNRGTEATLDDVIVTGKNRKNTPKFQQNVTYNIPMGAIEYTGEDGNLYWMRLDHSTGQYFYGDRNLPISYAKNLVPEGYTIPETNIKINKGSNIGKISYGLKKKFFEKGGLISRNPLSRFKNLYS